MKTRMLGVIAYAMIALVVAGCCGRTVIEREPSSSTTVVR
jgi:hypothetical protein